MKNSIRFIKRQTQAKQAGFSMIELLIVIAIIGLIVSLVAPEMLGKVDSTKRKAAVAQMQMLQTALDTYRLDTGKYPDNLNQLVQASVKNWDGPYLPKSVPEDPWGNPYVYSRSGKKFNLKSLGEDGQPGGQDDAADLVHE